MARKFSDDESSSEEGGDLGFFQKGDMVLPFEETVFSMDAGEIKGLVETEYGFHIIRLDDVRAEIVRPFLEVRTDLENEIRSQKLKDSYAAAAQNFGDLVYTDYDSLMPVSESFGFPVERVIGFHLV